VREAERMRIARELHDELAQWLTALKMDVSWLAVRLPRDAGQLTARTEKIKSVVDTTVAAVRRIASDLRPVILDDLGLVPAIEYLLHGFSERTGIVVSLDVDATGFGFKDPLATAVYRMLQEALTNVARHAEASEVQVTIRLDDDQLVVRVRDNGKGIDLNVVKSEKSFGILGIKERARTLAGRANIYRHPESGTVVEITLPAGRYRTVEAS
jgi:signal transduction histidine kinase